MRVVQPCFLAALIVACGDSQGVNCNDFLRTLTVVVTDTAGQPLNSLSSRTVVRTTQAVLTPVVPNSPDVYGPGRYEVVSDSHKDSLQQGDSVLDFAAWDASQFATGTFVVVSDGCHISKREGPDTIVATSSSDASPVQTDADLYILKREFKAWRAYPKAIYRNTTSAPVYFDQCFLWSVRRTGADSTRTLFSDIGYSCGGGPLGSIAPGEAVMVRVYLGSNDQPYVQPPLQQEWLVGRMRIELRLCREPEADSDYCDVLPQPERESNAFEVRF